MNNYKCEVDYSTKFKKTLKKVIKQGKDINKLEYVVAQLANKESLEEKYRDHQLINNKTYKNCGSVILILTGYLFINILMII